MVGFAFGAGECDWLNEIAPVGRHQKNRLSVGGTSIRPRLLKCLKNIYSYRNEMKHHVEVAQTFSGTIVHMYVHVHMCMTAS